MLVSLYFRMPYPSDDDRTPGAWPASEAPVSFYSTPALGRYTHVVGQIVCHFLFLNIASLARSFHTVHALPDSQSERMCGSYVWCIVQDGLVVWCGFPQHPDRRDRRPYGRFWRVPI